MRIKSSLWTLLFCCTYLSLGCTSQANDAKVDFAIPTTVDSDPQLQKIILPEGFRIDYYAENVDNARSMCLSPSGTLFVGTRSKGNVYALKDTDNDHVADIKYTIRSGLRSPNGVAFKNGDLYVAEINRILVFRDIENTLDDDLPYDVLIDSYPNKSHHGWKYIAFGPDGKLYVPVGAPCNVCESNDPVFNSITRIDVEDQPKIDIVHQGIRNTVGFTWHPVTNELWFTDNGRDWMGDDLPACELNYAPADGLHFGFPYCHQGDLSDPEFGEEFPCSEFVAPVQKLGPHVAPLGLEFYTGEQFPSNYENQIFIAEHGSWNRSVPIGFRVTLVTLNTNQVLNYEVFAEGWLQGRRAWGRPVDLELLPDGSLLVSDDQNDAIYRISYDNKE
jgi:glucose/arabinose dehydrogenase